MKKLSIEEKAKAYDEALERAKKEWSNNLDNAYKNYRESLEIIFPELKESRDERIRKALKEYFINSFQNNGVAAICGVPIKDVFAWLEKQDEMRLWSIKDAKDGDVLVASDKSLFIYDGSINENGSVGFHIAFTEDMGIILNSDDGCGWEEKDSCHPATKKQRDLLFQKMKESGYEWNADDKKLIKVEQNTDSGSCSLDEDMIKSICEGLQDVFDEFGWSDFGNTPIHDIIDWLKKIEQRIG